MSTQRIIIFLGTVLFCWSSFAVPLPAAPEDQDFYADGQPAPALVTLGQALFFDKILSGNRNVSCATCHHPLAATGDGLSLPVGEGAAGLGVTRTLGVGPAAVVERVPRNAPPLFNLGAREFTTMFHDGRVRVDPRQASGFLSPAGAHLPDGLDNVLAVQAMFPVTSGTEMAGQAGENPVADAAAAGQLSGPQGVWAQLARRLQTNERYVDMFRRAFTDIRHAQDITYVHAANAIAAYEANAWRADDSPFDRFLRGDRGAMSRNARRGMRLFYGNAGCARCHAGKFQTDHRFYAIGVPQVGPGKGDGAFGYEDYGLERVTGLQRDRYRFRVPTLRNVAITGPWGHDGAFGTLANMVRHHFDPLTSLVNFDRRQMSLPSRDDLDALDFRAHDDLQARKDLAAASELPVVALDEDDLNALLDFLHALTDTRSLDLRHDVPVSVPSALPVHD